MTRDEVLQLRPGEQAFWVWSGERWRGKILDVVPCGCLIVRILEDPEGGSGCADAILLAHQVSGRAHR